MNLRLFCKNKINSSRLSVKYVLTRFKFYKALRQLYHLKHKGPEPQIFIATNSEHHSVFFTKPIHPHEHSTVLGPQNDRI